MHEPATTNPCPPPRAAKVTLLPLIAATYFMVAGGPYGLEEVVKNTGYGVAVLVLLLTPILWSLPTALMVSELSAAVPEEGGYYAWVRRAMGPFWGFQEAWLSLAASVFDMAIYPSLFVRYLSGLCGRAEPFTGAPAWFIGAAVIATCVAVNLRGARTVGRSSLVLIVVLLGPFVVLAGAAFAVVQAPSAPPPGPGNSDLVAGILAAMWNYMGWDNASTIAGEVDRPQRTYPLAMGGTVLLVVATYALPVLAAARTGLAPDIWTTGTWVQVGTAVLGPALGTAIALGGMIGALGMFNSLVLSFSRVPAALAQDGLLPAVLARCSLRTGVPWVSVLACAVTWALALQLSLPRLFALDVILYGLSLLLEFAALLVLRLREPNLARPFRVPGGTFGAAVLGLGPALLIGLAIYDQASKWEVEDTDDLLAPAAALLLGATLAALGPVVYAAARVLSQPALKTKKAL